MKFYMLSGVTFYDCINNIYQFIKPFLDNKMSILRNMEPLILELHPLTAEKNLCLTLSSA